LENRISLRGGSGPSTNEKTPGVPFPIIGKEDKRNNAGNVEERDISQQTAKLGGKPKYSPLGNHKMSTNNQVATRDNAL